ncbi:Cyclin-like F-box [Penicillium camemberti]|uniref:Cyclin-like F-box n=1 Tax=Penicillium camemberti (strain FM 013) TaxID=1429867 RepID=A0A0G4NSJ9_PENC3|nr:Cyclin-like F-box [Penicillium camemberti]
MATTNSTREQSNEDPNDQLSPPANQSSFLGKLPAELIQHIASYLSASDLACFGATCRALANHASDDLLWANLVNKRLPTPIRNPGPFGSFRRLYLAYHPYWFIPQHTIWFADNENTGMLIIARYDDRRGVIEGYPIIAERGTPQFQIWASHPEVIIQSFEPNVHLKLDRPILSLRDPDPFSQTASTQSSFPTEERHMSMAADAPNIYNSLSVCAEFCSRVPWVDPSLLWPPPTIPANAHTVRALRIPPTAILSHSSELSELIFRLRRWAAPELMLPQVCVTFSTLDPVLYTPTAEKPYQGIWVGDYSAHGCEFLLVLQEETTVQARGDRNESQITDAQDEVEHDNQQAIGQRGPLQAVKLTGDHNVPRGQLSFAAQDIGSRGLIGIGTEEPFIGARIVRCRGHVAGLGFRDDTYIDSQLILISPNHMAHYWKEMGHVSYYRRVNIDALLHSS